MNPAIGVPTIWPAPPVLTVCAAADLRPLGLELALAGGVDEGRGGRDLAVELRLQRVRRLLRLVHLALEVGGLRLELVLDRLLLRLLRAQRALLRRAGPR